MVRARGCRERLGEGAGVHRVDEQSSVAGDLLHARARRGDHRGAVRHGLQDGQAEALPDGGERECARARVGGGQVGVAQAPQDVEAPGGDLLGQGGLLGGVLAPSGRAHQDQVEVRGGGQAREGAQQGGQVLAGLAGADPQDVGAREGVGLLERPDLVRTGRGVGEAVGDHRDPRRIEACRDAVVRGGPAGDDDGARAPPRLVQGTTEVGVAVAGEVRGVAHEGDVVDGDRQGLGRGGDRPRGRVDGVRLPGGPCHQAVHSRCARAVPRRVEQAPGQAGVDDGDGEAD